MVSAQGRYLCLLGLGLLILTLAWKNSLPVISRLMASASNVNKSGLFSIAYVTVPNEEVAKTLAHGLVKQKYAACVNIIPKVTSVYEWKNEINEDSELLLMIKTRTARVSDVVDFVKKNHPYEVCEVITTPIDQGNPAYLDWIAGIVPENSN